MGLTDALAGMDRPCPRCDAQPGEACWDNKRNCERITTHTERKEPSPSHTGTLRPDERTEQG